MLMTRPTRRGCQRRFSVDLDQDGDGVLSISEFAPLAKAVGADGADAVQEIFNQLDTHGNGVISESEFLAFSRQTLECDDLDGLGDDRGTRTR
jgi:Ca2+-binding EF-hand superfamily protein